MVVLLCGEVGVAIYVAIEKSAVSPYLFDYYKISTLIKVFGFLNLL